MPKYINNTDFYGFQEIFLDICKENKKLRDENIKLKEENQRLKEKLEEVTNELESIYTTDEY